ncbi:hypothetical protein DAPPUDRAFT_110739 [Daphnia pulex]|uniref:Uncharacterized protein n=1 Tax=Daphnia pulex TaxID=6669 RepID=E9H6V1_DAPPU|nr:hypothetical protein DAPPUDRAFT_110739 [Daphnia pulex]|eukprot:EFX72503.1 hypothetical protein DAPPUDRAFT_110739 [Daphnia pulex]
MDITSVAQLDADISHPKQRLCFPKPLLPSKQILKLWLLFRLRPSVDLGRHLFRFPHCKRDHSTRRRVDRLIVMKAKLSAWIPAVTKKQLVLTGHVGGEDLDDEEEGDYEEVEEEEQEEEEEEDEGVEGAERELGEVQDDEEVEEEEFKDDEKVKEEEERDQEAEAIAIAS